MAKKASNSKNFNLTCHGIISSAVSIFLFITFLIFPLYYDNFYINMLATKWGFYCSCAISILAVCLFLGLVFVFVDFNEFKGLNTKDFFSRMKPANWKKVFSLTDAAIILFLLVCIVSTLQSDYRMEAFTGEQGRRTGLALTFLYVAIYFLVSRLWDMKGFILEVFLFSGLLVCLLGISDYFYLDWLGFHENIAAEHYDLYVSTIGNINTYTAYVALVMGFAAAMFAGSDQIWRTVWYYFCMVVSFFAIIMGCSDNAYLALGALFGFIPLLLFGSGKGISRYFVMVATFFSVVLCIDFLNERFASTVIGLDSLFGVIASMDGLFLIVIILWVLAVFLIWWERKKPDSEIVARRIPIYLWSGLIAVVFLVLIYMLFDVNVSGNAGRYGALAGYLEFNDNWGTNRGYVWRKTWETYCQFPLFRKLVGYGPETFRFVTHEFFYDELVAVTGQPFDNAHNEYLQYLVTIGGLGLLSYLVFLVSSGRKVLKAARKNIYATGIFMAVLCYLVQAAVNLNVPIVAPVLWLLISCGGALCRRYMEANETA